jgi:hypothetical protein
VIQSVASLGHGNQGGLALFGGGSKSAEWLDVEARALALVQEVAVEFQQQQSAYPGFYQTYARLVQQGVIFPLPSEPNSAVSPSSDRSMSKPPEGVVQQQEERGPRAITEDEIEKLEQDLRFLVRKMDIADRVLELETVALDSDEALDILDFLLQCKPRVVELIQASAMGLIYDNFLVDCIGANDRLCDIVDRLEGRLPRKRPKPAGTPKEKKRTGSAAAASVPKLRAPPRARAGSTDSRSSNRSGASTKSKSRLSMDKCAHPFSDVLGGSWETSPAGQETPPPLAPPPARIKLVQKDDEKAKEPELNPFDFFAHQLDDSLSLVEKTKQANDEEDENDDFETLLAPK